VYEPTVNMKLIQEHTAPCDNNKHNVYFEPNSPTSKIDADFETSPSYIVPNFVKVGDSTANTDTDPHAYNSLCYDRKLHDYF